MPLSTCISHLCLTCDTAMNLSCTKPQYPPDVAPGNNTIHTLRTYSFSAMFAKCRAKVTTTEKPLTNPFEDDGNPSNDVEEEPPPTNPFDEPVDTNPFNKSHNPFEESTEFDNKLADFSSPVPSSTSSELPRSSSSSLERRKNERNAVDMYSELIPPEISKHAKGIQRERTPPPGTLTDMGYEGTKSAKSRCEAARFILLIHEKVVILSNVSP